MKNILLIGLGRFGQHIAAKLNDLNYQVMAVDQDEERVNQVLPIVTNAQIGDSTSTEFLRSLGIRNYDVCIVAIGDDFQNSLETASVLKDLGAKKVIARAASDIQEKFLLRNGADEVVYPESQMANWTAVRCLSNSILDYIELDHKNSIFELSVPAEWDGKSITKLDIRRKYGINILGIRDKGELKMNVTPDAVLYKNSSVLILGNTKSVQKCFHM